MKKRFLPLSMLLITMVLAQAGHVANATGIEGKYVPRSNTKATVSSYMKSIRANQKTGLIDPALLLKAQKAVQTSAKGSTTWNVMGPDNYGALTRAMLYDQNDPTNNTLFIGTMGGHIFKTTNGGITMQQVAGDFNAMISDMVQYNGTIYVATGDGRNSFTTNPLSDYGYETGFVGTGIWKYDGVNSVTRIPSTNPETNEGWEFVNELAVSRTETNHIFAATNGGLKYSTNNGDTWTTFIAGNASSVKMGNAGVGLASVDNDVYRITVNGANLDMQLLTNDADTLLPGTEALKVLAISPSDANYMYVGYIDIIVQSGSTTYQTGDIYFSSNGGVTWEIALPASTYDIFGSRGYIDNAMEVFPNNPKKLLAGGKNVWVLEYAPGSNPQGGVYIPTMISDGEVNEIGELALFSYIYAHCGIQRFAFCPTNSNVFFVGTEGGVFKGVYAQSNYSFSNCNRYFITDDVHTSVARMFGVGVGGYTDRVLGGCLDHGTILMQGSELINNITTGNAIFPNSDPTSPAATTNGHGVFTEKYAGGQCAISTISPTIMFVSATGSMTTPLYRTETSGYDFDMANFYNEDYAYSKVITNSNVFRTPFAMYEDYDDQYSLRTTYFVAIDSVLFGKDTTIMDNPILRAGDSVKVHSNIAGYPFDYVLPCDMNKGDTIFDIQDIISATLVCGVENNIYMTKNSHYFNEVSEWWCIGHVNKLIPTAVAIRNDGDVAIVGTSTGELFRISNLREAVTAEQACIDSTGCVVVFDTLDNSLFAGRTITAVSVYDDYVLLTTGNYGNDSYVFLSEDGGDSFVSKQNGLPEAPVYSCLVARKIVNERSEVIKFVVGTEYGIYISEDGNNWQHNGEVKVPVTDLKQALVANRDYELVLFGYDVVTTETGNTYTPIFNYYDGVYNDGMIYAATYGNGIIGSDFCKVEGGSELGVTENGAVADELDMSIYPNPVVGTANAKFELSESQTVRYDIYDLSGRLVTSHVIGSFGQGSHNVSINVDNLTCGTYIVRVQAGNKTKSSKIVVF